MLTPEKSRACDARESVTFAECVRSAREGLRERTMTAVNNGDVDALSEIIAKFLTGGPATVSPTRLARFLLGQ